ncbi:hypothetical protein AM305_03957, partial [Actinobacillus minor NM305]
REVPKAEGGGIQAVKINLFLATPLQSLPQGFAQLPPQA